MEAKRRLAELKSVWRDCTRCGLSHGRSNSIVFGSGASNAQYLFVYDVPTEDDAATSSPMAGNAGTIFSEVLQAVGIDIAHCYCTPVLGCRPTALLPATEDNAELIVDRAAKADEVKACKDRLDAIIYAVDPLLIFALGELPWKTLVRTKDRSGHTTLDKAVGDPVVTYVPGRAAPEICYPVIPLPSVKQLVASPSMAKHGTGGMLVRHLTKGKDYVAYIKASEQKDRTDP